MDSMKRQKDTILEDAPSGQRVSNMLLEKSREQLLITPRKNEVAGPMQKQCSAVDISGGESKKSDAVKNNIA